MGGFLVLVTYSLSFQSCLYGGLSATFNLQEKQLLCVHGNSSGFMVHGWVWHNEQVSFPEQEKEKLLRALENTQALTWLQETESKRLIGFA